MLYKCDCFLDLGRCDGGGDDWLDEEAVDLRDEVDRRSDAPCVLLRCFLPESTDFRCCPECVLRRGGFPWNFCTIADTLVLCFTAAVLLSSSLWGGRETEGSLECFTPTSTASSGEGPFFPWLLLLLLLPFQHMALFSATDCIRGLGELSPPEEADESPASILCIA